MSAPEHGLEDRQLATLTAIAERLIPSDGDGAGAREAQAVRYVLRSLGDAYRSQRELYAEGLTATDAYARATRGAGLLELSAGHQDEVLSELEQGIAWGFAGRCDDFFELVRQHVLEGMFGDPLYGGNERLRGWALLGYPGPRASWSESDQQLDAVVAPMHEREPGR